MRGLKIIFIVAIIANLSTVILYFDAASQPGGTGAAMVFTIFWMPAIWLISLIIALIIAIRHRKSLFKKASLKLSLPVLLFCTPVPLSILFYLTNYSNTYQASTGYRPENGVTIRDEEWIYRTNQRMAVHKFFKLNSEDYRASDDSLFKKDRSWVYFGENGDTTKIERYHDGVLLSTVQKKK